MRALYCMYCDCHLPATTEHFHADRITPNNERAKCKVCSNRHNREYYRKNKKQRNEHKRNYRRSNKRVRDDYDKDYKLRREYGISLKDYEVLYEQQNGRCWICNDRHEVLSVDHDHDTDKVRGLLCQNCNTGLGMFRDNVDLLLEAIVYLRISNNEIKNGE